MRNKSLHSVNVGFFYRNMLSLASKYKNLKLTLITTLLVQNAGFIISSLLIKSIFDHVIAQEKFSQFKWCLFSAIFVVFLTAGSYYLSDFLSIRIGSKIINELRIRFYKKIQKISLATLNKIDAGQLLSTYSEDFALLRTATNFSLWYSLAYLTFIPVGLGVLFYLNWSMTLALLFLQPLFTFVSKTCVKGASKQAKLKKKDDVNAINFIREEIASQIMCRVLRIANFRGDKFSDIANQASAHEFKHQFLVSLTKTTISTGQLIIRVGSLALGSYWVYKGWMTISALIAFTVLLNSVTACVNLFAGQLTNLLQGAHALANILDFIGRPSKVENQKAVQFSGLKDAIIFSNVSLTKAGKTILSDITCSVSKGQAIMIIGPSGAGKTSLLELLFGLESPTSGNIYIDHCDITNYQLDSLLCNMGIVLHQPHLFTLSIFDNIRLGKLDATLEEVYDAAKLADIHEDILLMPEGYDTLVLEQGKNLSAGQCQRLAIARALVNKPSILLLDEVTANLDPASKHSVNQTLSKIARLATTIRITHDLSEAKDGDVIYKMEQGQLYQLPKAHIVNASLEDVAMEFYQNSPPVNQLSPT